MEGRSNAAMSWGRHGEGTSRGGQGRGFGAGAWERRRRRFGPASFEYDAVGTDDPTWMSLSLDGSSHADPTLQSIATVSLEELGQSAPALRDDALIVRAERPDVPPQPTVQDLEGVDAPSSHPSSSGPSSDSSSDSVSISVSDPSGSMSLDGSVTAGDVGIAVAPPSAFVDELTEAIEVPMPPPITVRLADEPLPWPLVIVSPSIVLPGSWPPPLTHLGESEPSGIRPYASMVEELALDRPEEVDDGQELDLDAPSEDSLIAVRPRGRIDFEDSAIDLVIEDPSVIDSISGLLELQHADSVDEPPVRGTLDEMPVLQQQRRPIAPAVPSVDELLELTEDEPATEVAELDALEAALEALRTAGDGDGLSLEMDDIIEEEDHDGATATAEDLLSLEFDGDPEQDVDPDVVADLAAVSLPSGGAGQAALQARVQPGIFIELGGPSPAVVFSIQPAVWLETVDPQGIGPIDVAVQTPSLDGEHHPAPPEDDEDDTPTAPAQPPLPRVNASPQRIDASPVQVELQADDDIIDDELDADELDADELDADELDADELDDDDDIAADLDDDLDLEPEDEPADDLELEPRDEANEDTLRVPRRPVAEPDADESIDFVLVEGDGPATLTLEGDSVNELGPLMVRAEAGAIRVDLALGAPVPQRDEATRGAAVAPPKPVRSWEGKTGAEPADRATDLVALARLRPADGAAPPEGAVVADLTASDDAGPGSDGDGDDDWLAELPEEPAAEEPDGPEPGKMSPTYEDTVPGWLAGPEIAGDTRGGPRTGRPAVLAPLPPEADTDVLNDD